MNNIFDDVNLINQALQDDISKTIFSNRILFSMTNDSLYLRNICMTIPEVVDFINWMNIHRKKKKILFGAGVWGKCIKRIYDNFKWEIFVDNNIVNNIVDGIPVVTVDELIDKYSEEAIVITSKYYCRDIYNQLLNLGISKNNIYLLGELIDKIEKRIYFDLPELNKCDEELFLDVGGYDGTTTISFSKWAKNKYSVVLFEPSKRAIEKCKENIKDIEDNVTIIQKGVGCKKAVMCFQEADTFSKITNDSELKIPITTIDEVMGNSKVSFIKMDIEGMEVEALKGAMNVIKNNKPKLAISIYHNSQDVIDIPKLILEMNSEYKLWIRHYTMAEWDTILYAI